MSLQFVIDDPTRNRMLSEYRDQGYIILKNIFDHHEINNIQYAWKEIYDERSRTSNKPNAPLLMAHHSYPTVARIVRHSLFIECIEIFLGGRIELIQSQLMFGMPGTQGFTPHQDNFYNQANPSDGIIAAWIAVNSADEENGGVAVFPGSHKRGLVQVHRDWLYLLSRSSDVFKSLVRQFIPAIRSQPNDSGVMERFVSALPPEGKAFTPSLEAGSVLFMHGDLIHFSSPNLTKDRARFSLLTNYVKEGTTYSSGRLTGRTPFNVYKEQI
jgi:phytanoyl-CoA hydroxylase